MSLGSGSQSFYLTPSSRWMWQHDEMGRFCEQITLSILKKYIKEKVNWEVEPEIALGVEPDASIDEVLEGEPDTALGVEIVAITQAPYGHECDLHVDLKAEDGSSTRVGLENKSSAVLINNDSGKCYLFFEGINPRKHGILSLSIILKNKVFTMILSREYTSLIHKKLAKKQKMNGDRGYNLSLSLKKLNYEGDMDYLDTPAAVAVIQDVVLKYLVDEDQGGSDPFILTEVVPLTQTPNPHPNHHPGHN